MENKVQKASARQLPKLEELIKEDVTVVKANALNILLNQQPPEKWLKTHPTIKRQIIDEQGKKQFIPYVYIPIERQEWLMTRIFIRWRFDVVSYSLIGNAVCVHGRLHYYNPVTGEWEYKDGVGAQVLQTQKGAGATDFDKLNSAAVQMALPAAKTFAKKDAMDELGRLFGKDINRLEDINYNGLNEDTFDAAERIKLRRKISGVLEEVVQGHSTGKNAKQAEDYQGWVIDQLLQAEADGTDDISFLSNVLQEVEKWKPTQK